MNRQEEAKEDLVLFVIYYYYHNVLNRKEMFPVIACSVYLYGTRYCTNLVSLLLLFFLFFYFLLLLFIGLLWMIR